MIKQITSSRIHPSKNSMKEGEWRFALTGGKRGRLFHKFSSILHEFYAGDSLLVDGSNSMKPGTTLKAYGLKLSGLSAGTDNTVLVLDSKDKVVTDEIDSRVWGATLVGTATPNYVPLTDNSMADTLHRHSELSASDGRPDAVVSVDSDGILYADAAPTGLDVLYTATIGTHLIVGNDIKMNNAQQIRIKDAGGTENNVLILTSAVHTDELLLGAGSGIDNLSLATSGTRRLFIDPTGNVGIGTASPTVLLHLKGVNPEIRIQDSSVAGGDMFGAIRFGNSQSGGNFSEYARIVMDDEGAESYLEITTTANSRDLVLQTTGGKVGIDTTSPTLPLDVKAKVGFTAIGGLAIKVTNKTGGNTVAGQLVRSSTGTNDAFSTCAADSDDCMGIVLDAGVADGSKAWIIISGVADVLMDAGGSARGDRIISSVTAGSADVWNTGGAVATHFQEIGHCIETRGGAGLARAVVHFN